MVNVILILPLTLSQYSLCEPSSTAQICCSLRDYSSMRNPICHATFTLLTASNNKIIFHWIRTVVTAWKSPAGLWETNPLIIIFLKQEEGLREALESYYGQNRCTGKEPCILWQFRAQVKFEHFNAELNLIIMRFVAKVSHNH